MYLFCFTIKEMILRGTGIEGAANVDSSKGLGLDPALIPSY